jgi:hypothetical protein
LASAHASGQPTWLVGPVSKIFSPERREIFVMVTIARR